MEILFRIVQSYLDKMLKKNIIKFLLTVFLLSSQTFNAQNFLELSKNGTSVVQIVIPAKFTDTEKQAAFTLKKYLDKISGGNFPVVYDYESTQPREILVGNTSRSSAVHVNNIQEDAVIIKTVGEKLLLTGGKRKGTLYAVSTFLENYLGCRKYTKDFEVVPTKKDIKIPTIINIFEEPVFNFRNTYFLDANDRDYADWHKLNYFFEDRINFVHSFNQYLPDTLFKSHPEYFALVNGRRSPVQPCLSNPEVYKIIKANLMKEMAKYPNNKIWSVSQTDDQNYCHCNICEAKQKKGNGFIETLMPFINKLAADFPNKTISTLAYRQSIDPSKFVKPRSNVEIMLCFTHVNRALPIATGPDNAKMFRSITDRWKQQTNNIFVWDYVINYLNTLSPFPNLQVLQPNIQYFKNNSVQGVFEQGSGNQKSEFNELKCYLISKLLWNPNINVKQVQDEFIDAFYGEGAPEIKAYISLLEDNVKKNNAVVDIWADPKINKNDFLSETNIYSYKAILNKALYKTKNNAAFYNRILKEKLSVDYAEIQISSDNLNAKFGKKAAKTVNDFTETANKTGIIYLMNGEFTPTQYREKLLKNK